MARSLDLLVPSLKRKAENIIEFGKDKDVEILIYCTLRTLEEQAKLFRQGRSTRKIRKKQEELRNLSFDYFANIIEDVGPQYGNKVTNAAPGESWHNYAEAFDGVPMVGGKPIWKMDNGREWKIYVAAIREQGLYWAGDWKGFKEYVHVQRRPYPNPLKVLSPSSILEILKTNGVL